MSLPSATSIIRTMPSGLRVVMKRDNVVATLAVRTSSHDMGGASEDDITRERRVVLFCVAADFSPVISVGDVLSIDAAPAIVADARTIAGLITRAECVMQRPNPGPGAP